MCQDALKREEKHSNVIFFLNNYVKNDASNYTFRCPSAVYPLPTVTGENHIQLQLPHEDVSKEIKKLQFYHFHVKTWILQKTTKTKIHISHVFVTCLQQFTQKQLGNEEQKTAVDVASTPLIIRWCLMFKIWYRKIKQFLN